MKAIKLRLDDELYAEFTKLHPYYGEKSRIFRQLVEEYVQQKSETEAEIEKTKKNGLII